ncbi:PHD finger protein 14 [Halotydeus destructor]|nr:PHD finger protein 14 [Halotydeus destructor]
MPSASNGRKSHDKDDSEDVKYTATGSAFDFLHKKRDHGKRKVKPVDAAKFQDAFMILEDSESDDEDYKPKDEDDDDVEIDSDDGIKEKDDDDEDEDSDDSEEHDAVQNDDSQNGLDVLEFDTAADKLDFANKTRQLLVCSVCSGDQSNEQDEIVECDSCGITVHEGCYGIVTDEGDNESVHSNASSDPTEPWFCDACKSNSNQPVCELCPNAGGIFKQTDTGRWVHLVCCLYINGVAFADTTRLTGITLFELSYDRYGAKVCTLCEDERLARTGICVQCDAGMCKNYFHVTCAQKEGLLHEAVNTGHLSETELVDPFYAHCKLHAGDKLKAKTKRRNWLALQSRVRTRAQSRQPLSDRTLKKLEKARSKYRQKREAAPPPYIPSQKLPKLLTTSPKAVKTLLKKAELLGFSPQGQYFPSHEVLDIRRKWHIPPAFSVEFVSYYLDRNNRMSTMTKHFEDLRSQNRQLKETETQIRTNYESLMTQYDKVKGQERVMKDSARQLWQLVSDIGHQSGQLPNILESPKKEAKKAPLSDMSRMKGRAIQDRNSSRAVIMNECGLCRNSNDQHLLALCDSCGLYYHLGCLDPPLTRMPKKTRLVGWQCSECTEKEEEIEENGPGVDMDASNSSFDGPRRLRESRKGPDKFVPDADQNVSSPQTNGSPAKVKKRGRPLGSQNRKKKVKRVKIAVSLSDDGSQSRSIAFDESSAAIKLEPGSLIKKRPIKSEPTEQECCKCKLTAEVKGLVQCDECKLFYHFGCLDPPVKKSPKQRGYNWFCQDCDSDSEGEDEFMSADESEPETKPIKVEKPEVKQEPIDNHVDSTEQLAQVDS